MPGFHADGPQALLKGLKKHYEPLLKNLRAQAKAAEPPAADELWDEIERVQSEFDEKRQQLRTSLF